MTSGTPQLPPALAYNPALDGLRAIAVLLVVGFHAKVPGFRGGYIGVDVFFALSGYLITTILLAELERTGAVGWRPRKSSALIVDPCATPRARWPG